MISFSELVDSNYVSLIEQVLIQNDPKDIMIWTSKEFSSRQLSDIQDIFASQPNINFKMNEYNKKPSERMIEIIEKSCGHNLSLIHI